MKIHFKGIEIVGMDGGKGVYVYGISAPITIKNDNKKNCLKRKP